MPAYLGAFSDRYGGGLEIGASAAGNARSEVRRILMILALAVDAGDVGWTGRFMASGNQRAYSAVISTAKNALVSWLTANPSLGGRYRQTVVPQSINRQQVIGKTVAKYRKSIAGNLLKSGAGLVRIRHHSGDSGGSPLVGAETFFARGGYACDERFRPKSADGDQLKTAVRLNRQRFAVATSPKSTSSGHGWASAIKFSFRFCHGRVIREYRDL